jgi:hypothetical protein
MVVISHYNTKTNMQLDGKSLERATELIERHILDHIEKKDIGQVRIQSNKIITIKGVRHEIDIYVTVDLKIGTQLIYIFECKNYKSKVISKNDIIIFDEKINVIGAQKGYFVAKKYSKDSINRAAESPRIELLILDNENSRVFDPDYFIQIKSFHIKNCNANMTVCPPIPFEKDFGNLLIELTDGRKQTVEKLIGEKISLGKGMADKFKDQYDLEKNHNIENKVDPEFIETITFKEDNWVFKLRYQNPILNKIRYDCIEFLINVTYEFEIPEIIYEFNIGEKGHYVKLKFKDLSGQNDSFMEITGVGEKDIKIHNVT